MSDHDLHIVEPLVRVEPALGGLLAHPIDVFRAAIAACKGEQLTVVLRKVRVREVH